jgi:hypothetical protein
MRSWLSAGAAVLALVGGAAVASAQTGGGLGSTDMSLHLSAHQRAAVYQSVIKDKLRTPPPPGMPVTVGAQIPATTELYALPESVQHEAPSAKFYKYTIADNRVVIVDPTNMKVVDVIQP